MKWRNAADKHAAGAAPAAGEEALHLALAELSKHFNGLFFPRLRTQTFRNKEEVIAWWGVHWFLRGGVGVR